MGKNQLQKVSNIIRQAILKRRMPWFKKLVSEDRAWALYVHVVEKYIWRAKAKKMAMDLSRITPADLDSLKRLETEIKTLEWMIRIPQNTISHVLVDEQEETEKKLVDEVKEEQKNE